MSIVKLLLLLLLVLPVTFAQGVDWVEFDLRSDWARTSVGFCENQSQCLVSNSFNTAFDNVPSSYWDGLQNSSLGPKCIGDGQYIVDHYCDRGTWTARTGMVAKQLLAIGLEQEPDNFALYCDTYKRALNRFNYSNKFGQAESFLNASCTETGFFGTVAKIPCANNVCVLRYGTNTAFGVSLNPAIDSPKSVLRALDIREDACTTTAINNDNDFDLCAAGVWYNWNVNSLIYAPSVLSMPAPTLLANDFFKVPFDKVNDYVFDNIHNDKIKHLDFSFFNATPDFDFVYLAKNGFNLAYSFKQLNISKSRVDYGGWYFSNMDLPQDFCLRFVKRVDPTQNVHCEIQKSNNEFFIVARASPPRAGFSRNSILDVWGDTTGTLRVIE